jgi:hypothetical protein
VRLFADENPDLGQVMPLVRLVRLVQPTLILGGRTNDIDGALMSLGRHLWSIDVATRGRGG